MTVGTPLADAASFLETAIADQTVSGGVDIISAWSGMRAISASHAKAEPALACYVAGLLNCIGAWQEAGELLDLLIDELPAEDQRRINVDNVRALFFAVRGDYKKATAIWTDALQRATSADISLQNKIRINLALVALRTGNPHRARTCITDVVGSTATPDARASMLVASANIAVTALLTGAFPRTADITELDSAVWRWGAGESVQPGAALESTAQLASIYFDVATSTGQWSDAEQAVDVLESTAQSLSALLGADDPTALSVRTLLASAELRWALTDQSNSRVEQAVGVLGGIVRRCRRVLGPAHIQTIRTQVELAAAAYAICSARRSLVQIQEAIDASAAVTQLAVDVLGAQHPVAVRAADCLHDCRLLAAELIGLSDYIVPTARPRTLTEPPKLNISILAADEDTIRIRVSWDEDRVGTMRIRHDPHMPSWRPGMMVPAATIDEYGKELLGDWSESPSGLALEAGVPRSHRIYVPFMVDGRWAVAGHPASIVLPSPVSNLHARRTGDNITVGWVWPTGILQAEILWSSPDYGDTEQRVTAAKYQEDTGCRFPIGPSGGVLTARTIIWGISEYIKSDPISMQIDGLPGRISYRFKRSKRIGPISGHRMTLLVSADVDCADLNLIVTLSQSASRAIRVTDELTLCRFNNVSIRRDETMAFDFELPGRLRRPYVLRCSVESPHSLTIVDSQATGLRTP